jgi:small subunit ribosomal protein S7
MPRRNRPPKREVAPDIKYNSILVSQFINKLMSQGKTSTAQTIFYDALGLAETRAKRPGLEVFEQAVRNATPILEVKPRRVGGATYQVPVEVAPDRRISLANTGSTIKRREDTHKMAEANRAFAHYRW